MKIKENNEFEKSLIGLDLKYKAEIMCNWVIEEFINIYKKNKLIFEDLRTIYVLDFIFTSALELQKDSIELNNTKEEIKTGALNAIKRFEKIIQLGKEESKK